MTEFHLSFSCIHHSLSLSPLLCVSDILFLLLIKYSAFSAHIPLSHCLYCNFIQRHVPIEWILCSYIYGIFFFILFKLWRPFKMQIDHNRLCNLFLACLQKKERDRMCIHIGSTISDRDRTLSLLCWLNHYYFCICLAYIFILILVAIYLFFHSF